MLWKENQPGIQEVAASSPLVGRLAREMREIDGHFVWCYDSSSRVISCISLIFLIISLYHPLSLSLVSVVPFNVFWIIHRCFPLFGILWIFISLSLSLPLIRRSNLLNFPSLLRLVIASSLPPHFVIACFLSSTYYCLYLSIPSHPDSAAKVEARSPHQRCQYPVIATWDLLVRKRYCHSEHDDSQENG